MHCARVFGKHCNALATKPVSQSKLNKINKGALKCNFSTALMTNCHQTWGSLQKALMQVLEYMFGNHKDCGEWCYALHCAKKRDPYKAPTGHALGAEKDKVTCVQLEIFFDDFISEEQVKMCTYPYDKQSNEALNQSSASYVPKTGNYGCTVSLQSRVAMCIGVHNFDPWNFIAVYLINWQWIWVITSWNGSWRGENW